MASLFSYVANQSSSSSNFQSDVFLNSCFKPGTFGLCQVKKAVQALQAFLKTTATSKAQLLEDSQPISLLFTLWRIPKKAQTIRM